MKAKKPCDFTLYALGGFIIVWTIFNLVIIIEDIVEFLK